MPAKRLTKQEEMNILREAFKRGEFIDNGSSRAVYQLDDKRVIKVAFDNGGKIQNSNELDFFNEHPSICAPIYAYGEYILVAGLMVEDLRSPLEDAWEYCEYDYGYENIVSAMYDYLFDSEEDGWQSQYDASNLKDALDVLDYANEINGHTLDNVQIGVFADGSVRLYDYGFISEVGGQVGSISTYIWKYGTYELLLKVVNAIMRTLNCNHSIAYIRGIIYKDSNSKFVMGRNKKPTHDWYDPRRNYRRI